MKFSYEKLELTKLIYEYIGLVYGVTEQFPDSEKFGLVSQINRSAVSILLNVAEGSARYSNQEYSRFVKIAIGSLVESDAGLKLSMELSFVPKDQLEIIEPISRELYFKLIAFRKYLLNKKF